MHVLPVRPMEASIPAPGTTGGSPASGSSGLGASPTSNEQLTPNDFISLLVAQLQSQDPLNPMDPTTFVNQLVQFNTLQQVMSINQEVGAMVPSTTGSQTGTQTGSTTNGGSSPTGAATSTISQ